MTTSPSYDSATEIMPLGHHLVAKPYYSGFELAHDTYNAITAASDGKVYYVLCSESHDQGGRIYRYDPLADQTEFLGDLTEICGEKEQKTIAQGKSHVRFYEHDGKLYFATHVGYYEMIDGMERLPEKAPEGFGLYPGGHFLSYDLASGEFEDLAIAPDGEGILTLTIDRDRAHLYALTWPLGKFLDYNLSTGELKDLGLTCGRGEAGVVGEDYRVICRSMLVDPRDGSVYISTAEGDILIYKPGAERLRKVNDLDLRLDYFGKYDPTRPGNMGYNWRKIFWYAPEEVAYGVHGNSGYLFKFDPKSNQIEIVDRITSEPSRKSGMFDQFSYGYLGFQPGPDGDTIYYLTGGPIYENGKRVKGADEIAKGAAKGLENLHLITYHIPTKKYRDHGPIFYDDGSRPTYVNSVTVGNDGSVYTLARFEHGGNEIQDLVKIPSVF
ncbi:hypothetical protein [Persicitalea jodogahamensis]|uniref:Uncharacterized protein n=1 Tax=Persicitalea jodogahamensis TaxID=402147 RepID=A0A8J3DA46_9BACT|nr:hypothetical protein [Persicitalea jodogahamensis]GHB74819.1 hypothetical protein GCM10007390_30600 [Persicitalea jodogahamensis]